MKREDAANLTNHYYRLYTSIRPIVDTSPPISLYSSPKSTFYQPFSMRTQSPKPQKTIRRKGQEELAHFLALKRTRSQSQLGFNSFAKLKTESCLNLAELDNKPDVRSKLLDSRNYQPPLRLRLHSGDSPSSSSSSSPMHASIKSASPLVPPKRPVNRQPAKSRWRPADLRDNAYAQFKDRVLSEILLRNIFTTRVIEDCFRREIEKHPELHQDLLLEIMSETMIELGIEERPSANKALKTSQKHVKISEEAKREIRSLSSGSQTSSSKQSSSSSQTKQMQKIPATQVMPSSNLKFRINASPPRSVSSLSDIDEIARRLSNSESFDFPDREQSLDSFEDDSKKTSSSTSNNDEFSNVMEKAKRKV